VIAEAFQDALYGARAATYLPAQTPRGELIGTIVFLIILAIFAIADLSAVRRRPRPKAPARKQRRRRGSSS
jgi:hypothetical protein